VSLDFGGKGEVKACAAWRIIGDPQAAAMRFHDGAADPKSHASAVRLRSKERIKDLVRLLKRKPKAGITNRHHKFLVLPSLRLDAQFARPIHIPHRIDAVNHQIHQHLLQLDSISHDPGNICLQLCPERHGVPRCFTAQEDDHLANDFVYINQLSLRRSLLEELADSIDDVGGSGCILDDSRRSLACFFHIGWIARKPSQARIAVGDGGGNRLIHFVREGSGQLSHGG